MGKFVPLHLHTDASLLDGLSKVKQVTKRCIALGYTSCAITNHGNVSDCIQFAADCKAEKIKPILG